MTTWRKGDKKPGTEVKKETNAELIHNIKKAVRFDTGSHRNIDGMRTAMDKAKVVHDESTVVWVTAEIDRRIAAIRDAQSDRLDIIAERLV